MSTQAPRRALVAAPLFLALAAGAVALFVLGRNDDRCPLDDKGFCDLARGIEVALEKGDLAFFLSHTRYQRFTCPIPLGLVADYVQGCSNEPDGAVVQRINVADLKVWGNGLCCHGSTTGPERYKDVLQRIVRGVRPGESDDFGFGALRIQAAGLGRDDPNLGSVLVTAIVKDPEWYWQGRIAVSFDLSKEAGAWTVYQVIYVAPNPSPGDGRPSGARPEAFISPLEALTADLDSVDLKPWRR